ncbi:MAG: BlaI/MecI/CopY family transcriptional regulator [Clostridia bacterium]|nr:BlaI/MecI/CopY family transcriptional regulator [Clostridia bacterium]
MLAPIENQFASIIWSHAPLSSGELVKLCETHLGWKKSTTYTVLRRLCEKGLFHNESGTVTVLISREEYEKQQSNAFVAENYGGSLPRFLAAFSSGKKLSQEEVDALQALIDENRR